MSESRGHSLPESHLLPDAVVAYVDRELSAGAQERAAAHIAHCPSCSAEVTAQRQARTAVRDAGAPAMSAGFLANLRSIPENTEVDATPDNLAVTEDGQLVTVQRPDRVAGLKTGSALGASPSLGESAPLGDSPGVLGGSGSVHLRRRTVQGAGVVVSGLVLSALAFGVTGGLGQEGGAVSPTTGTSPDVLRAQFNPPSSSTSATPPTTQRQQPPASTTTTSSAPALSAGQR